MSHHGHPPAPQGGHEKRDLNVRAVALSALALAGLIFFTLGACFGTYRFLESWRDRREPARSPMAEERIVPPLPRLQVTPAADLEALRREEHLALSSYEWVNKQAGIARIPIERAIDILAEKGLPHREEKK